MRRILTGTDLLIFGTGLAVYTAMRVIGLTRFPIYFFCDEAMQSTLAADLVQRGFRDESGVFLPPYFRNVDKWNLSLSVYVHAVSSWLFGTSVWINRATAACVTVLAAVAVVVMLRVIFQLRTWWTGPLVLSVLPVWFLHSRASFETSMMVAFYACFLCAYLLYRYDDARWCLPAVAFGAATFYSYTNGQGVMLVSSALLLLSDLRYHVRTFRARRRLFAAFVAATGLVLVQYIRFLSLHPGAVSEQLQRLDSIAVRHLALGEKLRLFGSNYLQGLSPWFWFALANGQDLSRHVVKGWGNFPVVFLPFLVVGLAICVARCRSSSHRAVLIAVLAAPFAASLVLIHNYRVLAMVIPATLLVCLGVDATIERLAGLLRAGHARRVLVTVCGVLLVAMNMVLLRTALRDGPTWYTNYGLYGMQYGAPQVFDAIRTDLQHSANARFLVSPDWANYPNAFLPFFIPEPQRSRVDFSSPAQYVARKREMSPDTVFVLPADEYSALVEDPKFVMEPPQRVIPYPDGKPGFYFFRMKYSERADAIFAAEREARTRLIQESTALDGETVVVAHSPTDLGAPGDMFDTDKRTLLRGIDANPFIIDLAFSTPRTVRGIALDLYFADLELTVSVWPAGGEKPLTSSKVYPDLPFNDAHVEFDVPSGPVRTSRLRIELRDRRDPPVMKFHVGTLTIR